MPPEPAEALERAQAVARDLGVSDRAYRERIRRDADRFGVGTAPEDMGRAFPYTREEPGAVLDPAGDEPLEVAGLALAAEVEEIPGSHRRQIVLEIRNRLGDPLAYRVDTAPTAGAVTCPRKRPIPHNALALAPSSSERRSECLYEDGFELEIRSVQTLALPELGYYYLSQVEPEDVGLPERTSQGHDPPAGPCDQLVSTRVERALATGEIAWRSAADFYARHDCEAFALPLEYRAFREDGERAMPAVSPR